MQVLKAYRLRADEKMSHELFLPCAEAHATSSHAHL